MLKIENDLRCRKRKSIRPFKKTLKGPFTNRYRVILTFFIIACLTPFLITEVRGVYGQAGISYSPIPVNYGSVPVGGSSGNVSFKITNTGGKGDLQIVEIPKWAPPERPWLTLESNDCFVDGTPQILSTGNSCTVTYSFHPYYVGEYSTPVNIRYSFSPYNTVNNLNVQMRGTGIKGTPIISEWPTASGEITYGQPLSAGYPLTGGVASVPGSFAFTNPDEILNAGDHDVSVTFTPEDQTNYNTVIDYITVHVAQAMPTITWENPADITHPTPLTAIQLNATASIEGTFKYDPAACTELPQGTSTLSVTFYPTDSNYAEAYATVTINVLSPIVTKEQVYDSWICTQRDPATGFPVAMYLCPDSGDTVPECSICITQENRCGNSLLSDVTFDIGQLRWVGPTNETVDFVTQNTIFRCIEGIDLCFSCGVGPSWVCNPDVPHLLSTPTVTTKMVQKIGDVWACSEVPDPLSGCFTTVFSCPNATDLNPCNCDGSEIAWSPSTFDVVSFNQGQLKSVGPGSDDPICQTVYFVTSECIYKCISYAPECDDPDPSKCVPQCFSYCYK